MSAIHLKKQTLDVIQSKLNSATFNEENTTILQNNALLQMRQITDNNIDEEYFIWELTRHHDTYHILYHNLKFNDQLTTTLKKSSPISLQGLIYLIQQYPLSVNDSLSIQLLTPWQTIIPIKFKVIKEEPYPINNSTVPSYYIELELNVFFSKLLPRTKIWVTKDRPHYLLKQISSNGTYSLNELP